MSAQGDTAAATSRPDSPILTPVFLLVESPIRTADTHGTDGRTEVTIQEIMADFPTKHDLQAMATSIVNALSKDLQDIRKQVDTVEEWVTDLEEASTSTDTRLTALEADQQVLPHQFIDVQLRLDTGENCNRRNNLCLRGIQEASMGPGLRYTVVALLNQFLEKPPTAKLELDHVHRVQGPPAPPSF